jgi:hypothetical protein
MHAALLWHRRLHIVHACLPLLLKHSKYEGRNSAQQKEPPIAREQLRQRMYDCHRIGCLAVHGWKLATLGNQRVSISRSALALIWINRAIAG